jgi:hypothetical protein
MIFFIVTRKIYDVSYAIPSVLHLGGVLLMGESEVDFRGFAQGFCRTGSFLRSGRWRL